LCSSNLIEQINPTNVHQENLMAKSAKSCACVCVYGQSSWIRMTRFEKEEKRDIYLSASVSVSLLDPVVVSWLERDGRAEEELRLAPPGPPPSAADDDEAAAIPVWLLVPVDEEVEAFL
jgi:hypothetical protein